jgi:hypothetical protein
VSLLPSNVPLISPHSIDVSDRPGFTDTVPPGSSSLTHYASAQGPLPPSFLARPQRRAFHPTGTRLDNWSTWIVTFIPTPPSIIHHHPCRHLHHRLLQCSISSTSPLSDKKYSTPLRRMITRVHHGRGGRRSHHSSPTTLTLASQRQGRSSTRSPHMILTSQRLT